MKDGLYPRSLIVGVTPIVDGVVGAEFQCNNSCLWSLHGLWGGLWRIKISKTG